MKVAESSPKRVINTERNGEIAHNKQLLLFSQYFQMTCTSDMTVKTEICLGKD